MAEIKFTSGIALAKLNGPDINLSMIKSKQTYVLLCSLARICIYSVKRNILCEWQISFANNLKKGYYFLNFEDEKQRVIKPTYAKSSL